MTGKAVKIFFTCQKILIELREKLYKVVVNIRAAERFIFCLGRKPVERVAEFVKESLYLIRSEKYRILLK